MSIGSKAAGIAATGFAVLCCAPSAFCAGSHRASSLAKTQFRISNRYIAVVVDSSANRWTLIDKITGQKTESNIPNLAFRLAGEAGLIHPQLERGTIRQDFQQPFKGGAIQGETVTFSSPRQNDGISAIWSFSLSDKGAYARVSVTLLAQKTVSIDRIDLLGFHSAHARVVGKVLGSPVASSNLYCGAEFPMGSNTVSGGEVRCAVDRKAPLEAGRKITYSAVIGVAPSGQLRRWFQRYLNAERPRPYSPFLHYNSWLDLAGRYTEAECLSRINTFGEELEVKRGVKLSSFLFDDGWDDPNTTWQFTKWFPDGFMNLKKAAARYGAGPGIWLSPWGGYGGARDERLAAGKRNGYEVDSEGLALSGPKYFARVLAFCTDMVKNQGVNQFKFDGTGSPDKKYPGSRFDSDFDAAITLIRDLRNLNPKLFVNLTTGTWPSPFWALYCDSIWRGGYDTNYTGVGPIRQQWITYRDGDTYHGVVRAGPLYPLNSLMLHGLVFATHEPHLNVDPSNAFPDEVQTYFGCGTQLQEMYITPSLLSKADWDCIARWAKWSRANQRVLVDTHWIGGDPTKLQVYGWAAWSPKRGFVTLRNPSNEPQSFVLHPLTALEVPSRSWIGTRWKQVAGESKRAPGRVSLKSDDVELHLKPFEVVTIQFDPVR